MSAALETLEIRLYYDFASSLCYVAHRVLGRMQADLDGLGVRIAWAPLDLARLAGWERGATVSGDRAENVMRVSRELDVPLRMPPTWLDSRRAMAAAIALALDSEPRAATWRERVFTAVYDEGRFEELEAAPQSLLGDLEWTLSKNDIAAGLEELERRTRAAWEENVTGVPTFMLDRWPFGGIQNEDTLRSMLGRFVRRRRARPGALAP